MINDGGNVLDTTGMVSTVDPIAEEGRFAFYERARSENLAPLWRVLHGLVTEEPRPRCAPALWKYDRVRPYLMEACEHISPAEAERRVLVLENPGLPGQSRITQSLFGGLQVILPGEVAPTHRHVASALRFIIEGRDAYTAVAGEKTTMEPGDFVITPSMTWHDHGNESDVPMVWLDGLDMHVVNLFAASFREGYPHTTHPQTRPEGTAIAEFGSNLLPVDHSGKSQTSPIFNYPYHHTREALYKSSRVRDPDYWHGYKMRYSNPLTGDWAMPTISTWLQLLPAGFKTAAYRSTDSTAYVVVEGYGKSRVGNQVFEWQPHDIFVVPSWVTCVHEPMNDAVLFGYSDRVIQEKLDFWREEKGHV
ncbi:gentisate 1,2-dioxygenase [Paraburkholderia caribensis]|uniref:gentisate 1,2-dioxygenase n=1 Tax=Paraburkholderia caribensis TaxID=75105 RepID=UPI001EEB0297|nr:gentisate 1,2-dioxygenase [Paraburkholderia caribensis]